MRDFFEKVKKCHEDPAKELWLKPETFNVLSYEGNITVNRGDTKIFFSAVEEDGILDMVISFKSVLYTNKGEVSSIVQVLSASWTDEQTETYRFPQKGVTPHII